MHKEHRAVVWGAGGFAGGELLRLLAYHPHFELQGAISNTNAQKKIGEVYPGLAPFTELSFQTEEEYSWDVLETGNWTVFSAGAHVQTMKRLPPLLERIAQSKNRENIKIVDLSGDFRLKDAAEYKKYYKHEHVAQNLLDSFTYGLPELNRDEICAARLIANPGCFATCAQLSILPMAAAPLKTMFAAIDAKTGSSGAGIKPLLTTHHPNRMNNYSAYKQIGHQHFPEVQGGWLAAGGSPETKMSFVPQRAPIVRGIFVTAHFFLAQETSSEEVTGWYQSYYQSAPFVRICSGSPTVQDIWGTNRCDISVSASGKLVIICAAIDNLVKGAAGQAVQNANLMNGFKETAGLDIPVPMPI